jgi:hypothetical protein
VAAVPAAEAVGAPVAEDVPVVAVAMTIKATRASLANRGGSNFRESCAAPLTKYREGQTYPRRCYMAGRSRSSFNKRLKERSRQEKQREKAEKRVQRKQEKPEQGADDDMSSIDFSAAQDQLALPDSMLDK